MRRILSHIADVQFDVVRMESSFVPYSIQGSPEITGKGDFANEDGEYQLREDLGLLETKQIELPESVKTMSFDLMATIKAELWGVYYDFETECGTEYDAEFEFRNEQVAFNPISYENQS